MHQPLKPIGLLAAALAMLLVAAAVPAAPVPAPRAVPAVGLGAMPMVMPVVVPGTTPVVAAAVSLAAARMVEAPAVAPRPEPAAVVLPGPPRGLDLSPAPGTTLPPAPIRTLDDVLDPRVVVFSPLLRFGPVDRAAAAATTSVVAMPADPAALLALPEGERVAVHGSRVPELAMPVCNSWVRSDRAPSLASLVRSGRRTQTLELGLLSWSEPWLPDEFDPDALKAGIGVREDEEVEVRLGLYPKFPDDAYQLGDHMMDTDDYSQTRAFLRAAWDW